MGYYLQDPDEKLDWQHDWDSWLGAGNSIASRQWAITPTGPTLGAIGAGSPNGRQFQIDAISDGVVTDTGTASHWALTDDTGSELLATGELTTPQGVTSGNTFTLTAFTIRFAAAVNQS